MKRKRGASLAVWVMLGTAPALSQTLVDPNLQIEELFGGPTISGQSIQMEFIGLDEFLVTFKTNGWVRHFSNGSLNLTPVLDVPVHGWSGQGLVGIAADPDFVNNQYVYLFYTEAQQDTTDIGIDPLGDRVYRYTWNGSALVDPLRLLDVTADNDGADHTSGMLAFGKDDKLYLAHGDLHHFGKLQNLVNGPDPDDTGVIFRLHTDGSAPPDNPFYDPSDPGNPMNRYFAYGLRNPFGIAFDPATGYLWETENGPQNFDEINLVPPGFNGGWRQIMGPDALDPQGVGDLWMAPGAAYSDPEFSWDAPICVIAIDFISSPKLGCDNRGVAVVADCNCGQLYRFEFDVPRTGLSFTSAELQDLVADNLNDLCQEEQSEILFGSGFGIVTDLEFGPDGKLYVLAFDTRTVWRISLDPGAITDADSDGVDDTCDCDTGDDTAFAQPAEVPRLRMSRTGTTNLGWDGQFGTAGSGTTYAVVSGDLGQLRTQESFAAACELAGGLPSPKLIDTRLDPSPGNAFYYLVEAANACGSGGVGDGSGTPDPRDGLDPMTLPPC